MIDKKVLTGLLAAFGASLCCITPVLAVLAGSTGLASSFTWMEPFRPYLIALTVVVLAYAWWDKLKPKKADIECACEQEEGGKVSYWYSTTFLALVTLFSAVMLSFPYWGDALIRSDKPNTIVVDKANLFKNTIHIEGMTCQACEATVEKVGSDVEGVISIKASTKDKRAIVEFDKSKTDIKTIMKAIGSTGYKPVSYEDKSGTHNVSDIPVEKHKESTTSKCSGGKCGAGKCGTEKCG
ncbi:MAG TPA: mercuric transport protein MerTP [Epsilonproteobacteria bacterium]|nr:mercuric transport protein MerTP [Campylobacterota bacterium]